MDAAAPTRRLVTLTDTSNEPTGDGVRQTQ